MEFSHRLSNGDEETLYTSGREAWIKLKSTHIDEGISFPLKWATFDNEKDAETWLVRHRELCLTKAYEEALEEDRDRRLNKVVEVVYQVVAYAGQPLGWVDFSAAVSSLERAQAIVMLNNDMEGDFRIVRRTTTQEFVA